MNDKIQKRLSDIPEIYRNHYRKAMTGRNRTAAIKKNLLFGMHGVAKN